MTTEPSKRHAIQFIFLTVLIDSIGFGIILPVMPKLIMELTGKDLAASAVYGGWLAFSFALIQFFSAPILGNLSDRFGRRPVLLFCLFAFGIDYMVMGSSRTIVWLFVGRMIAGIAGASFTPAYAYIADISPPEKRARNFGLVGAAFGFGFIAGPAIGGLLGALGTRAPFFAAGTMALLNFTFGYFALPETLRPEARRSFDIKRANPLGALLQMKKYPSVLGIAGAVFLWQLSHQVLPSTWAYYTIFKFGWSEAAVGASLAFAGSALVLGQGVLAGRLIPALGGERRAAVVGLVTGAVAYVGYATATAGWMMYAWMLTWFVVCLAYPSMNAMMSKQIPPTAQGELQGGVASIYSLSSILGPPIMTQLFGYFSSGRAPFRFPGAAFAASALMALASVTLLVLSGGGAALAGPADVD